MYNPHDPATKAAYEDQELKNNADALVVYEPFGVARMNDQKQGWNTIGGPKVPGIKDYKDIYDGRINFCYFEEAKKSYTFYPPEKLAYTPEEFRSKYILDGWNPASILIANSEKKGIILRLQNSVNAKPSEVKALFQLGLIVHMLAFISPGADLWVPCFGFRAKAPGSIGNIWVESPGFKISYSDAVKFAYDGKLGILDLGKEISKIDITKLDQYSKYRIAAECVANSYFGSSCTVIPVITLQDLVSNWDNVSWRYPDGLKEFEMNEVPKFYRKLPLPSGACKLIVLGDNVNINSKPQAKTSIGKVNTGDVVTQLGNPNNGFIPVSFGDKSGWVSSEFLGMDNSAYATIEQGSEKSTPGGEKSTSGGKKSVPAGGEPSPNGEEPIPPSYPDEKSPLSEPGDSTLHPKPPEKDVAIIDKIPMKMSTAEKVAIGVGITAVIVAGIVIVKKISDSKSIKQ